MREAFALSMLTACTLAASDTVQARYTPNETTLSQFPERHGKEHFTGVTLKQYIEAFIVCGTAITYTTRTSVSYMTHNDTTDNLPTLKNKRTQFD